MTAVNSALPLPTKNYDEQYMIRLVRQLRLIIERLDSVRPITVGSDTTQQGVAYPISGLTIVNVPTSPTNLPVGSVWCDTSNANVLKIVTS